MTFEGSYRTKKRAEQEAAIAALDFYSSQGLIATFTKVRIFAVFQFELLLCLAKYFFRIGKRPLPAALADHRPVSGHDSHVGQPRKRLQ